MYVCAPVCYLAVLAHPAENLRGGGDNDAAAGLGWAHRKGDAARSARILAQRAKHGTAHRRSKAQDRPGTGVEQQQHGTARHMTEERSGGGRSSGGGGSSGGGKSGSGVLCTWR